MKDVRAPTVQTRSKNVDHRTKAVGVGISPGLPNSNEAYYLPPGYDFLSLIYNRFICFTELDTNNIQHY